MIARFFIHLPYDLLITEEKEWPALHLMADDFRVRIYAPGLYAERPEATGSVLGQMGMPVKPPTFTENLLVNDKKVAQVNVLVLDFVKPEFDRSERRPPDPNPELVFEIANEYLARIRVYSGAFQIKPVQQPSRTWSSRFVSYISATAPDNAGVGIMQSIFSPAARRDTLRVRANLDRRDGELKMLCILVQRGFPPDGETVSKAANAAADT